MILSLSPDLYRSKCFTFFTIFENQFKFQFCSFQSYKVRKLQNLKVTNCQFNWFQIRISNWCELGCNIHIFNELFTSQYDWFNGSLGISGVWKQFICSQLVSYNSSIEETSAPLRPLISRLSSQSTAVSNSSLRPLSIRESLLFTKWFGYYQFWYIHRWTVPIDKTSISLELCKH